MVTLTEALSNLEKQDAQANKQVTPNPSKFVYSTASGSKDVHVRWTIGGRAYTQKKVYRNPQPIFGMDEISFENPESSTSRTLKHDRAVQAATGVVNISSVPKLPNTDTKGEGAMTTRYEGMYKIGGAGTDFAEAHVQKIEELKFLKGDSRIEIMQLKQFEKQNPMKSTRHGASHGSGL